MQYPTRAVIVPGVFDIIHVGHIRFLETAKDFGNYLVVSLLNDEAVVEKKGKLPVMPFEERMEVLQSLRVVDEVIEQVEDNIDSTLEKLWFQPAVLIRSQENKSLHGIKHMESFGGHVVSLPYTESVSSTEIKERIYGINGTS